MFDNKTEFLNIRKKVAKKVKKEILWRFEKWGNTFLLPKEDWSVLVSQEKDKSGCGVDFYKYKISVVAGTGRKGIVLVAEGDDFNGDRCNPATTNKFDLNKELKKVGFTIEVYKMNKGR
jgi:hypothetical protein